MQEEGTDKRNEAVRFLKEEYSTTYYIWNKEEREQKIKNYIKDREL